MTKEYTVYYTGMVSGEYIEQGVASAQGNNQEEALKGFQDWYKGVKVLGIEHYR